MGNTVQDEIYRSFLDASQQQATELKEARQSLADLILQADQVRRDMAQQTTGAANTVRSSSGSSPAGTVSSSSGSSSTGTVSSSSGSSSTKASSSSQSSGGSSVLSEVMGVFKSGLGLSPLIKGIFSLFGGGGNAAAPPPLVKYALPPAIDFQAADVGG